MYSFFSARLSLDIFPTSAATGGFALFVHCLIFKT
jgi:hypothetical protein